jgi:hypothetical protein
MANWPKARTALAIARPLSTLAPSRGGQRHDPEQPVGVWALRRAGHLRVRLGVEFKAAAGVAAAPLGGKIPACWPESRPRVRTRGDPARESLAAPARVRLAGSHWHLAGGAPASRA